jgi:hypothetical protein
VWFFNPFGLLLTGLSESGRKRKKEREEEEEEVEMGKVKWDISVGWSVGWSVVGGNGQMKEEIVVRCGAGARFGRRRMDEIEW